MNYTVCNMKFLKQLFVLIIVIIVGAFIYKHYKKEIAGFLTDKGINIPGITDDSKIFPTSNTVTDPNGNSSFVVNIPSAYTQNVTPDMISSIEQTSEGRLTASTNEDGSIELAMTPEYRQEIVNQISAYFDQTVLAELITGNIVAIDHNEFYSVFTVTCNPGIEENEVLTLAGKLFAAGKAYASLSGFSGDSILVVFVSSDTGEVRNSYRSDNIGEGIASDAGSLAEDLIDRTVDNLFS